MNLQISSDWTGQSKYYIDFAKGSVIHSKATSSGQFSRYFRPQKLGGNFAHLTYAQSVSFFKKNKTAELYLQYLRALALNQIERISQQASIGYIKNNMQVLAKAVNTMDYPIAQNTTVGFVRSSLDRQKLVNYMTELITKSIQFGQASCLGKGSQQTKEELLNTLRNIAFAKEVK